MELTMAQRMEYFSELIRCGQTIYYWQLDPALALVSSNCPEVEIIYSFLSVGSCRSYLTLYLEKGEKDPLILSDTLGLSWVAAFEAAEGRVCRVHLIGPCFTSDVPGRELEEAVAGREYPPAMARRFLERIRQLPVTPLIVWMQYGLMLHFAVTGEKREVSDFQYQTESGQEHVPGGAQNRGESDSAPGNGVWLAEQEALRMIEEGRPDYKEIFGRLSASAGFSLEGRGSLAAAGGQKSRQSKNAVLSFITLATRAAIRGGMDAETAYLIGNRYMQSVENAATMSDLAHLNATMYDDFVMRVYRIRNGEKVSPAVRTCCNYIDRHLSENLSLARLAAQAGYSGYYLAQKFRKEMGCTVSEYRKRRRIRQACLLLEGTSQSVQEISEHLGFCNPSYFTESFRGEMGTTPGEYRRERGVDV
ncbi:MAG: AraC family transcriptional regulator [Eubacteriales bacterium]|nr:AraC family transcriptional regulator [Eubacteriales bacterium]